MKNKRKWLTGIILVLLWLFAGIYAYYSYVTQDQRVERNAAVEKARQDAKLVSVNNSWKSVWDSVYWTVEGTNADSQQVMVWIPLEPVENAPDTVKQDASVHTELLNDGMNEDQMRARIESDLPNVDIISLRPGVYDNQYVWQLMYRENDRYRYRFYRFQDGAEVGQGYTLPGK